MLDKSLTEFLEHGLAIHLGTRNEALRPNGCRVTAVRVEDQGRHLVAYLPSVGTAAVLEDLRSNGQAAVSFARPTDDRAVQVKGEFISARQAEPSEEAFVLGQLERDRLHELAEIHEAVLDPTEPMLDPVETDGHVVLQLRIGHSKRVLETGTRGWALSPARASSGHGFHRADRRAIRVRDGRRGEGALSR